MQEEDGQGQEENVEVVIDQKEDKQQLYLIKPENNRFPLAIVWTPLPFCTLLIPFIGHTGIGDAKGVIHDFGGPYWIPINFTFGEVHKYVILNLHGVTQ